MALHQVYVYEEPASAVRCDMVLHRAFRARHLKHEMEHLTSTGSTRWGAKWAMGAS